MKKDLVVFRCKNCIKDLKEYNPYVYPNGKAVPLSKIEIIEVEKEFCENFEKNLNRNPRHQAAINLQNAPNKPWVVEYWDSIYEREEGISSIFGRYETFEDAVADVENEGCPDYWACYEIQLDNGEERSPVYIKANSKPLADEFLKISV